MPLFRLLVILFLTIPVIEIYLLITVGSMIGAWPTILLIIATAVIGVSLLRWQGINTFYRLQQEMAQGSLPAIPMLEGVVLLVAGALLLTPGFFTDAIGFLLLVPPLRQAMIRSLLLHGMFKAGQFHPGASPRSEHEQPSSHARHTIEGEFERKDDDSKP